MGILDRIVKIFKRPETGAFVEVFLDYGFGRIEKGHEGGNQSFPIVAGVTSCLFIRGLSPEKVAEHLEGRRFDWHKIHSHWRHWLEINGYHSAAWADVKDYLRGEA